MKTKNCYNRLTTVILTVFFALSLNTGVSQTFPNCPGTGTLTIVRTGCFDYAVSLQTSNMVSIVSHTWAMDSIPFSIASGYAPYTFYDLATGRHTICITVIYITDGGGICRTTICEEISVPQEVVSTSGNNGTVELYSCPIGLTVNSPMYNPCDYCGGGSNYFEVSNSTGIVVTGDDPNPCSTLPLTNSVQVNCYYRRPDGSRCLLRSTQLVPVLLNPIVLTAPDQTLTAPCDITNLSYQIYGGVNSYTEFRVTGPNGFDQTGNLLNSPVTVNFSSPGNYVIESYNLTGCVKYIQNITVVFRGTTITEECTANLNSCSDINDIGAIANALAQSGCSGCANTVMNAQLTSPLIQEYVPGQSYRTVVKEYTDTLTCTRCRVTFNIQSATEPHAYRTIETLCYTVPLTDLPCSQPLKVRIVGSGVSQDFGYYTENQVICCDNDYGITNPTYLFYSEEDPCCFLAIKIKCIEEAPPIERLTGLATTDTAPNETLSADRFRIVPNPASSVFRIESNTKNEIYEKVEIRDMNSRSILTRTKMHSGTELDISKFNRGTYFVTVTTGEGSVTLKLVTTGE